MPDHWTYTTRCECCKEHIDHCVEKKRMSYAAFRYSVIALPIQSFMPCEECEKQTLQTLIAFDADTNSGLKSS